jgi:mono/diheme cytochrome c family protein
MRRALAAPLVAAGASAGAPVSAQEREAALAVFEQGRQQYHRTCAQCHGRNLVNAGVTTYDLRKFPEDQRERFFQSVTQGKGNMPSFADALDEKQLVALWAYVSRRGKTPE